MESIGDRIKYLRESLDLRQKDLADKTGITEATLSRYENNLREPKGEIVSKLAIALNVSTDYLLGSSNKFTNVEDKLYLEKVDHIINLYKNHGVTPDKINLKELEELINLSQKIKLEK